MLVCATGQRQQLCSERADDEHRAHCGHFAHLLFCRSLRSGPRLCRAHSRIFRNVNLKFIIGHTKYARSRVPNGIHALCSLYSASWQPFIVSFLESVSIAECAAIRAPAPPALPKRCRRPFFLCHPSSSGGVAVFLRFVHISDGSCHGFFAPGSA